MPRARIAMWAKMATWFLLGFALLAYLDRFYSSKFRNVTGDASWIWLEVEPDREAPAVILVTRNVSVPAQREYFRIKVAGDPEYVLYLNGRRIGSGGAPETGEIDLYEIDDGIVDGLNRIVIAGRSSTGYGGLIASIDFGPFKQNMLVTNEEWTVYQQWSPTLLHHDAPSLNPSRPWKLGKPPDGRWDFLSARELPVGAPMGDPIEALSTFAIDGLLPEIRVVSGVAIAGVIAVPATVFDFGGVKGRLRVHQEESEETMAVRLRFASRPEEFEIPGEPVEIVIGKAETEFVSALSREFRLVAAYGEQLQLTVIPDEPR